MKDKWTVADLIKELRCYPQNHEVVLEISGIEAPLDEVDLDSEGENKLVLRY